MDISFYCEKLYEVIEQRDDALNDVEVKKRALKKMKLQVSKNLKISLSVTYKKNNTCSGRVNDHMMQKVIMVITRETRSLQ